MGLVKAGSIFTLGEVIKRLPVIYRQPECTRRFMNIKIGIRAVNTNFTNSSKSRYILSVPEADRVICCIFPLTGNKCNLPEYAPNIAVGFAYFGRNSLFWSGPFFPALNNHIPVPSHCFSGR